MQCLNSHTVGHHGKRCDESSQNVQSHSLAVGHRKGCDENAFHKMSNVTHNLLVIQKRCDETAFHKICNDTHSLLVMGKDVLSQDVQYHSLPVGHRKDVMRLRLPFTKCAMSLTSC